MIKKRPLLWVVLFLLAYILVILAIISSSKIVPEEYSQKSLLIVEYWESHSLIQSGFIPSFIQDNKVLPYLSHPPLAYYFLYGFNKLFGFKSYYVLNGLLVAVSAFFVYLTICLLTLKKAKTEPSFYAWLGMIVYLSSYPILRFQFFNFHPDIFVLPFLIISQYLFLKLLMKERYRSIKYLVLIGLFLALLSYSSWFGAVFNFIIILIAIINLRKGYKLVSYIVLASFITLTLTMLIYGQYSFYGGWKNVIFYFKDAYWRESPFYGQLRQTSIQIFIQIIKSLGILLFALFTLFILSVMAKKRKFLFTKNGYRYLVLSISPVLIYSLLLIHYFQNTFVSLYFTAPLAISIVIWLEKLFRFEKTHYTVLKIVGLIVLSNLSLFLLI
jgi:hypothetical protein